MSNVNVVCVSDSSDLFSSKIYSFGYPPSKVLTGESKPILRCRDYNAKRVVCCMSLTPNEILQKTEFTGESNGNLSISLINVDTGKSEQEYNASCFSLQETVFTLSVQLKLLIQNALGNVSFETSLNRTDIFQPEPPKIELKPNNNRQLSIKITMVDEGEFKVFINCTSISPIALNKSFQKDITRKITTINIDQNWKPWSTVTCTCTSRIMFGNYDSKLSEETITNTQIPESVPDISPFISPGLTTYKSVSDLGDYLEDVMVYFEDLALVNRNGPITKYEWSCKKCVHDNGNNGTIDGNVRYIKLDKAYIDSFFSLKACTKIGCSVRDTQLKFQKLIDPNPNHERIFLLRNDDGNNLIYAIWFLNSTQKQQEYSLVVCYYSKNQDISNERECSSINIHKLGNESSGMMPFADDSKHKIKFALVPLNSTNSAKIRWNYCVHRNESKSDNLMKLASKFISFKPECHILSCKIILNIKMPSCENVTNIIIKGLYIHYRSDHGYKNITKSPMSQNDVEIELQHFSPQHEYKFEISLINHLNETTLWFNKDIQTNSISMGILIGIILAVLFVVGVIAFIIYRIYEKVKDTIFNKISLNEGRNQIVEKQTPKDFQANNIYNPNKVLNNYDSSNRSPGSSSHISSISSSSDQTREISNSSTSTTTTDFDSSYVRPPDLAKKPDNGPKPPCLLNLHLDLTKKPDNGPNSNQPEAQYFCVGFDNKKWNLTLNPLNDQEMV